MGGYGINHFLDPASLLVTCSVYLKKPLVNLNVPLNPVNPTVSPYDDLSGTGYKAVPVAGSSVSSAGDTGPCIPKLDIQIRIWLPAKMLM